MATAMQSKSTETPPRTRRHGTTATNSRRREHVAVILVGLVAGLGLWLLLRAAYHGEIDPDSLQVFGFTLLVGIAIVAVSWRKPWLAVIAAALALIDGILSALGNLSLGSGPLIWAMSFALFAFVIMACLWFYKKVWKA